MFKNKLIAIIIPLRLLSDGYSGSDIKPVKEYNQKKSFRKYLHTDEIIAVAGKQNQKQKWIFIWQKEG